MIIIELNRMQWEEEGRGFSRAGTNLVMVLGYYNVREYATGEKYHKLIMLL